MKYSFLSVVVLLSTLLSTPLFGAPIITFKSSTHDFGTFQESSGKVTCTFEFTNTGDAPIIITRSSASCGCTTPEFTKEPIAPGKKGKIEVTYNPKGRPGAFQKSVYVYANTEPEKTTLTIKGVVVPDKGEELVSEYPVSIGSLKLMSTHLPFFNVYNGKTKVESIGVMNSARTPLTLNFENVPRHLKVVSKPAVLAPNAKGEIEITYTPEIAKDWGLRQDNFKILFAGAATQPANNKITVSADIRDDYSNLTPEQLQNAPKISIEKQAIDFGTIKGTEPKTQVIRISNNGKTNLQIRKLSNENRVVEAALSRMSIQPGKSIELTVKVLPARTRSKVLNHSLYIVTNDPVQSTLSIPVLAIFE